MARIASPTPRFHERVTIPVRGHLEEMRVVLTEDGPLQSLIDYFDHLKAPSRTVQLNAALAVGMLWDFYVARCPTGAPEQAAFLSEFVRHLGTGTIRQDGSDPLDLNWYPVAPGRAREIVRHATAYSDYCALTTGTESLNPLVPATFPQRIAAFRRFEHQRESSLLKHVYSPALVAQRAAMTRKVAVEGVPTKDKNAPPYFPFPHTLTLFQKGFRRTDAGSLWERYRVRDMLIALLQRFGGLRASEPFHLFAQDVEPLVIDPHDREWGTVADVRVFHPSAGGITYTDKVTGERRKSNRAEYLMSQWGRIPRDQMMWHGEWAGWKDPLLDDDPRNLFTVHWYPSVIGAYFWRLYRVYLRCVRPSGLDHPYLFVNLDASRADTFGAPYRIESYTDQLERAVERIGLRSAKDNGTTSHGLRHAYAQSLRASGVSEKAIQIAMHHKSPLSQQVYTRPTKRVVARELDQAHTRIRELDEHARALRRALPTEIAQAEARLRAQGGAVPGGLLDTLNSTFPRLLP